MSEPVPPKFPKLIVVMAFDPDESGDLQPVGEPMEQQSEERAIIRPCRPASLTGHQR